MNFKHLHLRWFASINNIKLTVGLENTAGTAVARTAVVPITGVVGLDRTASTLPDPAIVGLNMATSEYLVFTDVVGDVPLAVRPTAGYAALVKSVLGQETTSSPEQVSAAIRIRYVGGAASSKLIFDNTASTIRALKGDSGSETGDADFGTGGGINGTLNLTAPATDTVGELVSVINAMTGYNCEKTFGLDAVTATSIVDATGGFQGKDRWAYGWFTGGGGGDSGVYRHVFTADLTDTEKPTLTLQKDGYQDNFLYAGGVVDTMQVAGALKALVEGNVNILGFTEASGATASALSLEDVDPLIFYKGDFTIKGTEYDFINNFEINFSNNHNPDGYGAGGNLDRQYHQKGLFESQGSMQVRLDATSLTLRNNLFNDVSPFGIYLELRGKNINATQEVPEMMIMELAYNDLQSYEFVENAGVFDANVGFRTVNPKGSPISDPVTVTLLTTDSAAY